jgi:TRAP transporter TAXI family solute receptor
MNKQLARLRALSLRDFLIVVVPLAALLVAGFWLASRFIQPAPPDTLVLASGADGGAYQRFAAAYREVLGRYGIRLVEKPSAGALENLQHLRDGEVAVDAGFFQGGVASAQQGDGLASLGGLFYEPLWVFYREDAARPWPLTRLLQLKGRRIAVGAPGSGTRHLALELLQANGIDGANTKLVDTGGLALVDAFAEKRIDAAFVVGPTQSATVWSLLYTPGVRLMSLAQAEAYTRRFAHLSKIVLPQGAIDLERNLPARDVHLVASVATLLVREDTHPALIDLLMQAAAEVHGEPGVFQKPGEFPKAQAVDFPLSKEAERYFKSGRPFLQRYLPFWAATLVDRMVVLLVPFFALLVPLVKVAPSLYSWRVRSRIYRRYGELKFLEAELESEPQRRTRDEWLSRLDAIESDVNHIPTPLAYAGMLYTLRSHIELVRAKMQRTPG